MSDLKKKGEERMKRRWKYVFLGLVVWFAGCDCTEHDNRGICIFSDRIVSAEYTAPMTGEFLGSGKDGYLFCKGERNEIRLVIGSRTFCSCLRRVPVKGDTFEIFEARNGWGDSVYTYFINGVKM